MTSASAIADNIGFLGLSRDAAGTSRNWGDMLKKAGNTYMNYSFGCGQDQKFVESIFGKNKEKVKMGVKDAWKEAKLGESWWQTLKDAFTPSKMGEEWRGYKTGDIAKGIKPAGNIRSAGRFFLKRMPFIGNAVALGFVELPNVYRAFTDKENGGGIGTGLKETAKAAVKMAAFATGAALGALVPGVGLLTSIAGGIAAGWLADKVLGKSFTDKKEEAEAEKAQKVQQAQQPQQTDGQTQGAQGAGGMPQQFMNPYGQGGMNSNSIFQMDWKDKDIMAMNAGLV